LQKTARCLLQLLSRALARLDKTCPPRVRFQLAFQQEGQAVRDVVSLDDRLMILLFLPKRPNSRQHIAPVIRDNLHRHAHPSAGRAQVRRDHVPVAVRHDVQSEHVDVVMVRAVALAT
jgi:hypothetical protein